jgi:tocopherol O-methyltransferase
VTFGRLANVEADVELGAASPPIAGSEVDPAGYNSAVERYYDATLDLYEQLWGEHVHHGYWDPGERPDANGADRHAATDRLVRELVDYARVPGGATVLDVGCGIGGPALHLAGVLGCTVDGVTLSVPQAARANEKARAAGLADRARFHRKDALASGYPDASFDVVWALESLMHFPDRAAFFAEAFRLLRPGGVLAAATWAVRDGKLDEQDESLVRQILHHQVMPSFSSLAEHERLALLAGFTEVASVDWSAAVANSWDPGFTQIRQLEHGRATMRELARDRGVDVLGFFYAGPLMQRGFETGAMRYGALRAVKPAAPGPDLLTEVVGLVREIADKDGESPRYIGPDTRLEGDLFLDSVDLIALDATLRRRYGDGVDLAGHVAGLGIDEIIGLTVADVAAQVARWSGTP